MGQASLALNELRYKFNILSWFQPTLARERAARRDMARRDRLDAKIEKEETALVRQIALGSIEGVLKEFKDICLIYFQAETADRRIIRDLLSTCISESKIIIDLYSKAQKDDVEYREAVYGEIQAFQAMSEEWLRSASAYQSINIQLSDDETLRKEMAHIADIFNLGLVIRQLRKVTNNLGTLSRKRITDKTPELKKKEITKLREFKQKSKEFERDMMILFKDEIKVMQLGLEREKRALGEIMAKLKALGYPERELAELRAEYDLLQKKTEGIFKKIIDDDNGFVRTLKGVRKN